MYFNQRNRPQTSVYGCSSTSLFITLAIVTLMIFGGLFFIFRYLGLIIALGIVVWLFRKFFGKNKKDSSKKNQNKSQYNKSWSKDYEKKENSSYDNIDREFEEVDDDSFDDF
ncbi:MAG: DUF4834 family protein [Atopostipes suicloacalis]|nr:DUF4834 family protein [Atopostipes suicloacalis]